VAEERDIRVNLPAKQTPEITGQRVEQLFAPQAPGPERPDHELAPFVGTQDTARTVVEAVSQRTRVVNAARGAPVVLNRRSRESAVVSRRRAP